MQAESGECERAWMASLGSFTAFLWLLAQESRGGSTAPRSSGQGLTNQDWLCQEGENTGPLATGRKLPLEGRGGVRKTSRGAGGEQEAVGRVPS